MQLGAYLCIENQNEVDPRAFTLLGASVKERDDAIGMFGSGTKYSLATLLRNGVVPRIFSGTQEIVIGSTSAKFRDQSFDIITINGRETSITTHTGIKWRVDQCIREFYSNALDEGGASATIAMRAEGEHGTTRVFIPMDSHPTPADMWREWNKYFIDPNAIPLAVSNDADKDELHLISATGNVPSIMRRGVWCVEEWAGKEAIFSYNLKNIQLPETRLTNSYSALVLCGGVICQLTDEASIEMLLAQADNEDSFEWAALNRSWDRAHPGFIKTISDKYDWIATQRDINHFPTSLRPRVLLCSYQAFEYLSRLGFKDIRNYRNSDIMYTEMAWPIGYADRVHSVKAKLARNGINISFPLKFVQMPNETDGKIIARADMRAGICLVTQAAFEDEDNRMLTKALIEEWTHLTGQVTDGSVAQQHLYLETIVKLLK